MRSCAYLCGGLLALSLTSCGNSELGNVKAALEANRAELADVKAALDSTQAELARLKPAAGHAAPRATKVLGAWRLIQSNGRHISISREKAEPDIIVKFGPGGEVSFTDRPEQSHPDSSTGMICPHGAVRTVTGHYRYLDDEHLLIEGRHEGKALKWVVRPEVSGDSLTLTIGFARVNVYQRVP